MCSWFGILSLLLSPPPSPLLLSLSLLLMAAKDIQITVKLQTLKRYFHGLFGTYQPGIFYQKKYIWNQCCPDSGFTLTSQLQPNVIFTVFAKLSFVNAEILSVFLVKPQMMNETLIMTPTIYMKDFWVWNISTFTVKHCFLGKQSPSLVCFPFCQLECLVSGSHLTFLSSHSFILPTI